MNGTPSWLRCGAVACLSLAVLIPGTAFASTPEAPHCGERYVAAAAMVDAAVGKYGTLYSGGLHHHELDDVGATVDLFRLWQGLPDLSLRDLGTRPRVRKDGVFPHWEVVDDVQFERDLRTNLALGVAEASPFAEVTDAWKAVVQLDLATSVGEPVDWWLPESGALPEEEHKRQIVRRIAQDDELLDWLQHVIVASDAPWAIGWHLWDAGWKPRDPYERVRQHALDRYRAGDGLEWAVAVVLFPVPNQRIIVASLDGVVHHLTQGVKQCTATAAEYAALSVMVLSNPGFALREDAWRWMSPRVREFLFQRYRMLQGAAWADHHLHWRGASSYWFSFPAQARELHLGVDAEIWAATFDTYFAPSPDRVFEVHAGLAWSPKSVRAINMMSARDLARFGQAPGVSEAQRSALLKVAFARMFALGDVEGAAGLLPSLQDLLPDAAADIAAIRKLRIPESTRHALILLTVPRWSTHLLPQEGVWDADVALSLWHSHEQRDLPVDFARGWAVEDDFETLLMLPQNWSRFWGMRGFTKPEVARSVYALRRRTPSSASVTSIIRATARVGGIAGWAAWEELERLSGRDRLSLRLAAVLLDCAEGSRRPWFERADCRSDAIARGLQTLIQVARRSRSAHLDGVPIGKRAFDTLHRHFPEAARQTRYWHNGW